ncbi:MAG: hypothetical protein IT374_15450 [Polyangiaceae bacterium]|nr:hypothetical protein [Polyangiaceae bacterium]
MRHVALGWMPLLIACGGAPAPADAPRPREPSGATGPTEAGVAAPTAPEQRSPCADGSCTPCGEGVCPSGYFCVDNHGKKGCSWLASCAQDPRCSCVTRALSGCACKDDGAIARVTCGG